MDWNNVNVLKDIEDATKFLKDDLKKRVEKIYPEIEPLFPKEMPESVKLMFVEGLLSGIFMIKKVDGKLFIVPSNPISPINGHIHLKE